MLPPRDPSQIKRYTETQSKGKKIFNANGKERKAGEAVLMPDKIDVKTKAMVRDIMIMIKGTI